MSMSIACSRATSIGEALDILPQKWTELFGGYDYHAQQAAARTSSARFRAIEAALADPHAPRTPDLDGKAGTADVGKAIAERVAG